MAHGYILGAASWGKRQQKDTPHTHAHHSSHTHTHTHTQTDTRKKQKRTISNRNRSSRDAENNHRRKSTNWLWQDVERTTESVEAAATKLSAHSSDQTAKTSLNTLYKNMPIPIENRIPTTSAPSASKHADKHKVRRLHDRNMLPEPQEPSGAKNKPRSMLVTSHACRGSRRQRLLAERAIQPDVHRNRRQPLLVLRGQVPC